MEIKSTYVLMAAALQMSRTADPSLLLGVKSFALRAASLLLVRVAFAALALLHFQFCVMTVLAAVLLKTVRRKSLRALACIPAGMGCALTRSGNAQCEPSI
jgi:hypothetical protein